MVSAFKVLIAKIKDDIHNNHHPSSCPLMVTLTSPSQLLRSMYLFLILTFHDCFLPFPSLLFFNLTVFSEIELYHVFSPLTPSRPFLLSSFQPLPCPPNSQVDGPIVYDFIVLYTYTYMCVLYTHV